MKELFPLIDLNSNILMLAPTAWGKTSLLLDLAQKYSLVYVSPLRALSNEFSLRCKEEGLDVIRYKRKDRCEFDVLILACEQVSEFSLEEIENEELLFIFDEFHLFYYWGEEFRPHLNHAYQLICMQRWKTICLSATASEQVMGYWKKLNIGYENSYILNLGNQKIKTWPRDIYIFKNRNHILELLQMNKEGTILVFCKYRKEVKNLADQFNRVGVKSLTCISGEVDLFIKALDCDPNPKLIFATTTLSHGVNLPSLKSVVLMYDVKNFDFLLQMIGRAGRHGESFSVYSRRFRKLGLKGEFLSYLRFLCHYYKQLIKRVIYHA